MAADTFRGHLPTMIASAVGAVACAFAGSYLGRAGTLGALIAGSFLSGGVSWWAERAVRRSTAMAQERARFIRVHGRQPGAAETQRIARVVDRRHNLAGVPWRRIAVVGAAAAVLGAGTLTAAELAAGKPASAIVQGRPGHGLSLDGGGPAPAGPASSPGIPATPGPTGALVSPPVIPSPSLVPASVSPSPAVSPSASPSPVPVPT